MRDEKAVTKILDELGNREALAHWNSICETEGRTKQSVFVTAQRILHVFTQPLVRDALRSTGNGDVFRARDLLDSGGTLYVVAPAQDQEAVPTDLRVPGQLGGPGGRGTVGVTRRCADFTATAADAR
ncbi:type IV secretory system conjugative DNA transfer family protein [Nocardioides sp. W3-2-3]|uniref:hypothetical protein n=1 Tax=Nocardioides convexus TaxID=2712224 RepID=UPI002418A976|nr:hypothetical protein [Nocardioides convexus]NHA02141.1 type IV secretory system conjugative DNA transfer family protein [Nocardioides convexus]